MTSTVEALMQRSSTEASRVARSIARRAPYDRDTALVRPAADVYAVVVTALPAFGLECTPLGEERRAAGWNRGALSSAAPPREIGVA